MNKFIILSSNELAIRNFLLVDCGIRAGSSVLVIGVVSALDMQRTVGLIPETTAWFSIPYQTITQERRYIYRSLELRFGPVWGQYKFCDELRKAIEARTDVR